MEGRYEKIWCKMLIGVLSDVVSVVISIDVVKFGIFGVKNVRALSLRFGVFAD